MSTLVVEKPVTVVAPLDKATTVVGAPEVATVTTASIIIEKGAPDK
jgi:hypothetical protein